MPADLIALYGEHFDAEPLTPSGHADRIVRDLLIWGLRRIFELSYTECGKLVGVSESGAHRMHEQAVQLMRRRHPWARTAETLVVWVQKTQLG